jgi:hypothetical protein
MRAFTFLISAFLTLGLKTRSVADTGDHDVDTTMRLIYIRHKSDSSQLTYLTSLLIRSVQNIWKGATSVIADRFARPPIQKLLTIKYGGGQQNTAWRAADLAPLL